MTKIPAGNHVIKTVGYDPVMNWTVLGLCCGLIATMDVLRTSLYKPESGDYYIVSNQGSASIIKKAAFEAATKPNMIGFEPMADTRFPFERTTAKPETMGMREENGYADKVTGPVPKTTTEIAHESLRILGPVLFSFADIFSTPEPAPSLDDNLNYLLSDMDADHWTTEFCKLNRAADHGTMLTWFSCAIMTGFDEANRRRDKDARNDEGTIKNLNESCDKLQNVIKSLTAQNSNKQNRLNAQAKVIMHLTETVNTQRSAFRFIDTCDKVLQNSNQERARKVIRRTVGDNMTINLVDVIVNDLAIAKII